MEKPDAAWTTFSTAMGVCGVSWSTSGIDSFFLPEPSGTAIEQRLKEITGKTSSSSSPPTWVRELIRKVKAHMKGRMQDFSGIPLDFSGISEFMLSVYQAAQKLPAGTVATYGELAALLGKPNAARAVGSALGKNPIPLIVPCHRVIASSGEIGGFSAPGGLAAKVTLLEREGVYLTKPRVVSTPTQWQRAVNVLQEQDRVFALLVRSLEPFQFRPMLNKEPLTALISAIVSQQLSNRVAATILNRVNALISEDGSPCPRKLLNTPGADLRKAGLSFMKASFLKDLAEKYLDGKLSPLEKLKRMSDELIIREFTQIKGVGRWTAEMYLIFNLGRADVFPTLDLGVRKAISQFYGLPEVPEPKAIEKYGELWRPYRSVASLYLWHSLNNK
ncbi:MAG: methylated-DNA--[protein]-cysteine S-methyltransferase [Desulfomonile tiedjei]|uniref:Methylated-DNA--[protein]-cysteine S-methyltransferase n=1 Tax=Desulfomonile tiedjei TaxID=2358 RepID=A0A9D6V598_9BACT|nr:methylated-DNA--[protein]-cysteine S-methyltransferase [Desulfomonile tiedjei]